MPIFVGSNPSSKNTDPSIPFEGTKSGITLKKWAKRLKLEDEFYLNVSKRVGKVKYTEEELADLKEKILIYGPSIKVVALGNQASKALTSLGIYHFKLPHPSGLNRKLNDPKYVTKVLKECSLWLDYK